MEEHVSSCTSCVSVRVLESDVDGQRTPSNVELVGFRRHWCDHHEISRGESLQLGSSYRRGDVHTLYAPGDVGQLQEVRLAVALKHLDTSEACDSSNADGQLGAFPLEVTPIQLSLATQEGCQQGGRQESE